MLILQSNKFVLTAEDVSRSALWSQWGSADESQAPTEEIVRLPFHAAAFEIWRSKNCSTCLLYTSPSPRD